VPQLWPCFEVEYRFRNATYHIEIVLASEASALPGIEAAS
jgi:hypothetical protein